MACNRRATPPVISRASLATGGKLFAALALALCAALVAGCGERNPHPITQDTAAQDGGGVELNAEPFGDPVG